MTNQDYLEAYHELTIKILPEIALRYSRGDVQDAIDLFTALQAKHDQLWSQYMAQASAQVAP